MKQNKQPLQTTLVRGLDILELVCKADRLMRLKDISEQFAINPSTALRSLQTLEQMGFIQKYEELHAYSAGPKINELTNPKPELDRLVGKANPYIEKLARQTGQCAHLGVLQGKNAILVGVESSPGPISIKQAVGDLEPLYSSAVGKAIYSFLPESERERLALELSFERHTKHTILTTEALEAEVETIRNTGVAFDNKEMSNEISCIACPILDKVKRPIASIGISMVTAMLQGSILEQQGQIEAVKKIAAELQSAEIHL